MLWAPVDMGLRRHRFVGIASWAGSVAHFNKWYHSPWSKKPRKSQGHMVTGEPVNVLVVTRVVYDM
jgi:hypothetical protein